MNGAHLGSRESCQWLAFKSRLPRVGPSRKSSRRRSLKQQLRPPWARGTFMSRQLMSSVSLLRSRPSKWCASNLSLKEAIQELFKCQNQETSINRSRKKMIRNSNLKSRWDFNRTLLQTSYQSVIMKFKATEIQMIDIKLSSKTLLRASRCTCKETTNQWSRPKKLPRHHRRSQRAPFSTRFQITIKSCSYLTVINKLAMRRSKSLMTCLRAWKSTSSDLVAFNSPLMATYSISWVVTMVPKWPPFTSSKLWRTSVN